MEKGAARLEGYWYPPRSSARRRAVLVLAGERYRLEIDPAPGVDGGGSVFGGSASAVPEGDVALRGDSARDRHEGETARTDRARPSIADADPAAFGPDDAGRFGSGERGGAEAPSEGAATALEFRGS